MNKLKDIITDKSTKEMDMIELMHNCVFVKDRQVWFRDFEREISARDLLRKIHEAIGEKGYAELDDSEFDEMVLEDTCCGYDTIEGALGLLYYVMIGFAEVREYAKREIDDATSSD